MMDRRNKKIVVSEQFYYNFNFQAPPEVVSALVDLWEKSGSPPDFCEPAFTEAIKTYEPIHVVANLVIKKAQRKEVK